MMLIAGISLTALGCWCHEGMQDVVSSCTWQDADNLSNAQMQHGRSWAAGCLVQTIMFLITYDVFMPVAGRSRPSPHLASQQSPACAAGTCQGRARRQCLWTHAARCPGSGGGPRCLHPERGMLASRVSQAPVIAHLSPKTDT